LFSKVFPEFLENMKINKRRTGTIGASKDAFNQLIELSSLFGHFPSQIQFIWNKTMDKTTGDFFY